MAFTLVASGSPGCRSTASVRVRLGHPAEGLLLTCELSSRPAGNGVAGESAATVMRPAAQAQQSGVPSPAPSAPAPRDEPLEIPYAVRWLVPRGERFANFDILNNNDTQLDYYRKFGHIYAVGIPTKKWRIVVVSDPDLLDDVAGNELQFGKRVEDINFFDQLSNSRGGGISVIGDGEHYDQCPPGDAALVRPDESADPARADEGSGQEAGRLLGSNARQRATRCPLVDGALRP